MKKILQKILEELKEHSLFTITAALVSIIAVSFLLIKGDLLSKAISFFYLFHPMHIFFSSMVSAAIFYKYKKKIFLAIISSIMISVVIGSVSDVFFPYIGSLLFKIPTSFHLPAVENSFLIFGVAFLGAVGGITFKKTKFPHFLHVFISILASCLYIFAYSTDLSLRIILLTFIITSLSVIIPCCLSDIVIPLLFQNKLKTKNDSIKIF